MERFDAAIVGAGPAGMMAAIRAGQRHRKVLLIERNESPGKKLLISGKGRCNLTNSSDNETFFSKFSQSRNFLRNAFAKFFNSDLISFFENSGLALKTERGGRVFPKSDRSGDVLNVLRSKLKEGNVKCVFGERVAEVIVKDKRVEGLLTESGKRFLASHVAIATGGASYPGTGSTGDGYAIAKKLGHRIVPIKPALSPIRIKERFVRDWQGISLKNIRLSLYCEGKKIDERFGEMLFTHFGISGPVVLDISASVHDALESKGGAILSINFKPSLDHKKLDERLLREFKSSSGKTVKNIFKNLLPHGIIERFIEYCGLDGERCANQITQVERRKLVEGLSDFKLTAESVMGVKYGIVTRGGVDTKEINPKTMESRLIKGLFFAGEVIDIDAKTGGYNMQAAFSTGWVLGDNI